MEGMHLYINQCVQDTGTKLYETIYFILAHLKMWSWMSIISITWELVKTADSQTPPRLTESETLPIQKVCFNKSSREF